MSDALTVHVNDGELHSLDLPDSFEASESFDVRLVNHGEATHVHLHLDDALSAVAAIDAPNHHVERESERRVRVTLTENGTARGNLKVVTAYGATTRYVDLTVREPETAEESVQVSEELGKPQPKPAQNESSLDLPLMPVAIVGALAVVLAVVFQQLLVAVAAAVVTLVAVTAVAVVRAS